MSKILKETQAIIIDNVPYCAKCGRELGNIKSHDLVQIGSENYIKFVRYCSNEKCNGDGAYYILPSLQDNIRIVFNESIQEEIVKSDKEIKGE